MNKDIEKMLYSEEDIAKRVKELGAQITKDYQGKRPIVVGVLKGAFVFMADLIRCIDLDCQVDFMCVSSYGNGTTSTGQVKITRDLGCDIEGRDLIIVEDILDSGITLAYLKSYLMNRKPASIKIVTLLNKPARRKAAIQADYSGFDIPDAFIVGYGLDYAEVYRNLPYVGILKEEVYSK